MDHNTYKGKIKRTRKRWRHYKRQLIKARLNPEYILAPYQVWFFGEDIFAFVGIDLAAGIDVTVYQCPH